MDLRENREKFEIQRCKTPETVLSTLSNHIGKGFTHKHVHNITKDVLCWSNAFNQLYWFELEEEQF